MILRYLAVGLLLDMAAFCLWGCSPQIVRPSERTPVRWIVVEKRVGEVTAGGWLGDGRVDPQAVVLTMQPLYREDFEWEVVVDPHEYFVEVLEISPSRQASPGETVSAKVRVGKARASDFYRLVARPSCAEVQIIGESELRVRGGCPAVFQFTSTSTGRLGIAVGVEKIE